MTLEIECGAEDNYRRLVAQQQSFQTSATREAIALVPIYEADGHIIGLAHLCAWYPGGPSASQMNAEGTGPLNIPPHFQANGYFPKPPAGKIKMDVSERDNLRLVMDG
jgi:hypothetical protein